MKETELGERNAAEEIGKNKSIKRRESNGKTEKEKMDRKMKGKERNGGKEKGRKSK